MAIDDLYTAGLASGWNITDASTLKQDQSLEADVVIVGSGAGGGTAAEILAEAGLSVLILEEGPLKTSASFKDMDERRAFADLYQEAGGRSSSDGAIGILQGRAVGGTTTINWTSSFHTPAPTLDYWAQRFALRESSADDMAPWFAKMEARLGIAPWGAAPNENNGILQRGAQALGWKSAVIPRNVRGCWNLGYCGLGCPTNAKQSMLVTTIPGALSHGARLIHRARVRTLQFERGRVSGLLVDALDADAVKPTGVRLTVRARHYVLAGGSINTPALLLRSQAPDPYKRVGKRTCIHPVNLSVARMPDAVNGYHGAPQSIYSDEFQWKHGATGPMGYKLEVAPMQPGLTTVMFPQYGAALRESMGSLPQLQNVLALMRDGFDDASPGGSVRIDDSGAPLLDYELTDYIFEGIKRAYLSMAELQFAAGAREVMPAHLDARWTKSWSEARALIEALPYRKLRVLVATAHLMGGCAMGEDEKTCVLDSHGGYRGLDNLSVFDGSMFPTSIGANPQLSIYGFVSRNATRLAAQLKPAPTAGAAG